MGILTDLHVHRFVLHQHLDSLNALTDTPIGHQPLTDTLPPPVQRLIAIYHNNVQRIQSHTRLALNAIDTMARFPPAAYFMDPNLTAQTSPTTHTETDPPPSSTSPLRFYPIPTAAARPTTLQDVATQTPPLSESILANPLPPLLMHESQQTTPRATPRATTHHRHIQTDIHAIVQLPSFAGLIPTADTNQPTTSLPTASSTFPTASPNPTSATNKQPHDRWQYVNLIPTPTVTLPEQPHTPPTFPSPIGGTPRNKRSKTPPRTTTPGSRIHAPVPPPPKVPPPPPTDSQQLQCIRFQSDLHHHSIKPHSIMLPRNPFSLCPRQLAGRASKADLTRLHHQWHHRQPFPHPRTHGQHITTFQRNNPPPSSHHKLVPLTWVHHPPRSCSTPLRQGWTRRGAPCHCHTRTMTPLRTRGMQITSDQAAAASEVPIMIYPGMIHTTTTPSHTFSVFRVCTWFCYSLLQHAHHHLRTSAQLSPQTNTLGFTLHNEKQCVSAASHSPTITLDYRGKLFLDFCSIPVFSAVACFFLFSPWS